MHARSTSYLSNGCLSLNKRWPAVGTSCQTRVRVQWVRADVNEAAVAKLNVCWSVNSPELLALANQVCGARAKRPPPPDAKLRFARHRVNSTRHEADHLSISGGLGARRVASLAILLTPPIAQHSETHLHLTPPADTRNGCRASGRTPHCARARALSIGATGMLRRGTPRTRPTPAQPPPIWRRCGWGAP